MIPGERLPPEFWGAWLRVSIARDGGRPQEPARVDWLQGPSAFADLRVPIDAGDELLCFAGTTTWSPPRLTWHHDLDLGTDIGADTGEVSWHNGDLVEEGVFMIDGRETPYVEVWRRTATAEDGIALRRIGANGTPNGRIVRVGAECLVVTDDRPDGGGFSAARLHWDRAAAAWIVVSATGELDVRLVPAPGAPASPRWDVVEEWAG